MMTLEDARRMCGVGIKDDVLHEWVNIVNARQKEFHLDKEPKGVTIDIKKTEHQ